MPKKIRVKNSKTIAKSNPGTTHIKRFMTETVKETLLEVNRKYVYEVAKAAAKDVTVRLRQQLFNHEPLAPSTVDRKKKLGLDKRILIATKFYVDNIGVQEVRFPKGVGYRVGVPEDLKYPDGTPLTLVARVHENGTDDGKIPARPHYRPVMRELQAHIRDIRAGAIKNLGKELRKRTMALRRKKVLI